MSRNPFKAIESDEQAIRAAKVGVVTACWIVAGCLLTILAMSVGGRVADAMLADAALGFGILCMLTLSGLVAGIGWLIWTRQPLWASFAVLTGLVVQYSYALANGVTAVPDMILTIVALGCGILSVRGAWYHRQFLEARSKDEPVGA